MFDLPLHMKYMNKQTVMSRFFFLKKKSSLFPNNLYYILYVLYKIHDIALGPVMSSIHITGIHVHIQLTNENNNVSCPSKLKITSIIFFQFI